MHLRVYILSVQSIKKLSPVTGELLKVQAQDIEVSGRLGLGNLPLHDKLRHLGKRTVIPLHDLRASG